MPPCNRASALAPRFPSFSSKITLFLFALLMTTAQKRAYRKRAQNYSFLAKLLFAYCERRGFRYVIGWRLFVLTYLSDKACHVHKSQGHPTSIFGKYLFGRRFEIYNFRNICCKISCLSASPKIFEHLNNGIISYF